MGRRRILSPSSQPKNIPFTMHSSLRRQNHHALPKSYITLSIKRPCTWSWKRIELQVSPPDLAKRIQGAVEWLSNIQPPSNPKLGPVGGGLICHKFFKDSKARFDFSDPAMLDLYTMKVRPWFVSLAFITANMSSGPGVRLALERSLEEGVSCQC